MKNILCCFWMLYALGCNQQTEKPASIDYAAEMRNLVINIQQNAAKKQTDFIVIPQNGIALVTDNKTYNGSLNEPYLAAINGVGQEDLHYGFTHINKATPAKETKYLDQFLQRIQSKGKEVLVTDYCYGTEKVNIAYQKNLAKNYIPFVATDRELNRIPPLPLPNENADVVTSLSQVQNFLYLLNTEKFDSKEDFIQQVQETNYDLLITDLFFKTGVQFSAEEVEQLKQKANGGKRLVIAYLSIGEAENYRYYWKDSWNENLSDFVDAENPKWEGNFKVNYWQEEWQEIIYGNDDAYLSKIIDSGFQGVYLDIIDAYQYYE